MALPQQFLAGIAGSCYSLILLASCFVVASILTGPIGLVHCRVWWDFSLRTLPLNSGEIGLVVNRASGKAIPLKVIRQTEYRASDNNVIP